MIQPIVYFLVFMVLWGTFLNFALYIASRICYFILGLGIKYGNEKQQELIARMLP